MFFDKGTRRIIKSCAGRYVFFITNGKRVRSNSAGRKVRLKGGSGGDGGGGASSDLGRRRNG
jgi:hypothetical protein